MKNLYSKEDITDYIRKFSPYFFKDVNGKISVFQTRRSLYYFTMVALYVMFPKWYVVMSLFISHHCGVPKEDAMQLVQICGFQNDEIFFNGKIRLTCNNDDGLNSLKIFLKNICEKLHNLSGSEFDSNAFDLAFIDFTCYLINYSNN